MMPKITKLIIEEQRRRVRGEERKIIKAFYEFDDGDIKNDDVYRYSWDYDLATYKRLVLSWMRRGYFNVRQKTKKTLIYEPKSKEVMAATAFLLHVGAWLPGAFWKSMREVYERFREEVRDSRSYKRFIDAIKPEHVLWFLRNAWRANNFTHVDYGVRCYCRDGDVLKAYRRVLRKWKKVLPKCRTMDEAFQKFAEMFREVEDVIEAVKLFDSNYRDPADDPWWI